VSTRRAHAVLLAGLLASVSARTPAACPEIHAEVIESVPLEAVWALVDRRVQVSPQGQLTTVLWAYDQEFGSLNQRNGLDRVGLLLAGAGDIGEKPLAVEIYCRAPCVLESEHSQEGVAFVWQRSLGRSERERAQDRCLVLEVGMIGGLPKVIRLQAE
jgi:hypothetical protein